MWRWMLVGALLGCEVDNAPPPLAEVEVKVDETSSALTTTTVTDPAALAGIDRVRGHLVIATSGPVRLPDLVVIEGDLRIVGTEARPIVVDLDLPKLARVGGNIELGWTTGTARLTATKLTALGGHLEAFSGDWAFALPLLETVNGDVRLSAGTVVEADLGTLRLVDGSIRIDDVELARGLVLDLEGLEAVGGNVSIRKSNIYIEASRLLTVGGDFSFEDGDASLGLDGLREVLGDLRFEHVTATKLSLQTLRTVGDDLVYDHVSGGDFAALELNELTDVGGDLRIAAVEGLGVVTLSRLAATGGDVILEGSPTLTQFNGNALADIGGALIMQDGAEFTASLDQVVRVGGDLVVANHLAFVGGFQKLAMVGGDLRISATSMAFTGMQSVVNIGGDLALSDITGTDQYDELRFERLRSLGGALSLRGTRSIEKFTVPTLLSVGSIDGGDLVIRDNFQLAAIVFDELTAITGDLLVSNNPLLPVSEITSQLGDVPSSSKHVCGNLGGDTCQ